MYEMKREISVLRTAIAQAEREGNLNMLIRLTEALNKVRAAEFTIDRATMEMISRDELLEIGREIVRILSDELQHIDGYEDVIDSVCDRLAGLLSDQQGLLPAPPPSE